MRAWVVGRGKRFTQYIVRFPTETPIRCQRSELFTHSREKPNTGLLLVLHKVHALFLNALECMVDISKEPSLKCEGF